MMHVVVFSYKPCWASADSPTGYATDGGFPLQIASLSGLFSRTTLLLPRRVSPTPGGTSPLQGREVRVETFEEPVSRGLWRKLWWLWAGVAILPRMWRLAGQADVVHALVPGDAGVLGLLVALVRRKRIFVRHCGTWGRPQTMADRVLHRLLLRVAGERCVVFATGGGETPPSPGNPAIHWIFSTSLSREELRTLEPSEADVARPRLICVGRLTSGKNVAAAIRALTRVRRQHPTAVLDVVGDGPERQRLEELAKDLELEAAVTFYGNVDHDGVLKHLLRARVFVFPTRVAEGFPKAVLEALACGVPVVVPRVSVLPHLLAEGGGVLLDDVESSHVSDAIRSLLYDPSSYDRHALAARQIAQSYTLEAWRDAIGERLASAWGEDLRVESAF